MTWWKDVLQLNLRIIGERSDESSKQDSHVTFEIENPFVMNKSIRSDVLLVSVGQ